MSCLQRQAAKKLEDLTGQKCLPVKMDVRQVQCLICYRTLIVIAGTL